MGIGNKLTKLMEKRGTNTNELAKSAGIPAQTIYSLIRRDAKKVEIDALIKICHALGVSADYFSSADVYQDLTSKPERAIAGNQEDEDWTEEELAEIEEFKNFLLSKRKNNR